MSARRAVDRFLPREGEPHIYSVGELISELGELLSGEFPSVLVQGEITDCRRWADLPASARAYVGVIENYVGVRVSLVSVGPDRAQTLAR